MKVIEFGTFNRAAAQLRISQPALSRRIAALEDELKMELFDRRGHGVTLTDAGQVLKDHAASLLHHFEQVRMELMSRATTPSGTLSVGLPAPFRSILSSTLVPDFCLQHPQVKLLVCENTPRTIVGLLHAGSLEVGVVSAEEPLGGLDVEPFVDEQLFLVAAPGHRLGLRKAVPAKRLADLPLVQAPLPSAVRALLARLAASQNITLNYNVEVDSIHLMLDVVACGHSCTVLPYSAISDPLRAGRVCAAPLEKERIRWVIARPTQRHISLAARRFTELLRASASREIGSGRWKCAVHREPVGE